MGGEGTRERERPLAGGTLAAEAPAPLTDRATTPGALGFSDLAAKHWLLSSIIWLTVVDLFGLVLATEFVTPEAFGGISWLSFSRIRPSHVNGVILAWLTMMYFGALFYMLPRLVGTRGMWSERLGVICAWAWNLMYLARDHRAPHGPQPGPRVRRVHLARRHRPADHLVREHLEHPRDGRDPDDPADLRLRLVLHREPALARGRLRDRQRHLAPRQHLGRASGALSSSLSDAILNWWYAHNLFGLWLTPMLLALTYYIVPRVTNTPLYSYTLSLISFWGMAFFYTGVGDHHILQSPTPSWLKTIAEVSSWMLLVPVFAFTINILGTMKGNWDRFFTNLPLRFTMTAFFFYFLVNIQGAFEAIQPFNKLTHFTNFVVAHAHLALLGAFTILGMGVIDYIVAQI